MYMWAAYFILLSTPTTSVESYRAFYNLQPGSWNYLILYYVCESLLLVKSYCMGHSRYWEGNRFSASKGIAHIEWTGRLMNTSFTSVCHLSLSWASSIQFIPHPTLWWSTLILSSHPHLGIPSGLYPSGLPTKTLYAPLPSPPPYMLHAQLISFFSILPSENYWMTSRDH